jgi:hypothetical protein
MLQASVKADFSVKIFQKDKLPPVQKRKDT